MRNARHGSIQSAVRAAIKAAGGLECASNDLGMSVANLSRASSDDEDRPGGLGVNHLHRLGRILPRAAVPVAQHFAHLAGGFYQPCPDGGIFASDISRLTLEFSRLLDIHARAMSEASENPNDYTPSEAQEQLAEMDQFISVAAKLRAALVEKAALE